jgi:hypothetical protein
MLLLLTMLLLLLFSSTRPPSLFDDSLHFYDASTLYFEGPSFLPRW